MFETLDKWSDPKWLRANFTIHRKNHFRLAHKLHEVCEKWNVGPKGWLDLDAGNTTAEVDHLIRICSSVTGDREKEIGIPLYDRSDYKTRCLTLILHKHGKLYCVKPET